MVTTSIIYLIVNKLNNKMYVGQTINIEERWNRHKVDYKRLTGRYLYKAMNKYGFENFSFEVIENNIPIDKIHEREIYWISELNSKAPNGYNMTEGGEGSINREVSVETRNKIKLKLTGRKTPDNVKQKQSLAHKKRYENPEEREKIRQSSLKNTAAIEKATKNIQLYNDSLSYEEKLINQKKAVEKLSKKVIAQSLEDSSVEHQFNSIREASRWIRENTDYKKACHTNISKVCRGKLDFVYGFKWRTA